MKKNLLAVVILFATITTKIWSQCDAPINLVTNYSNDVTTFSWDPVIGANYYTIEIKQSYNNSWTAVEYTDVATTNSLSLTGIMHSVSIDWRVNTTCNNGTSVFSEEHFTAPCPEPTSLNATNITQTSATISWIPAAGYDTFVSDFAVGYRIAGSNGAWTSLGHTSASSLTITGLTPGVTYEYSVNQSCVYFNGNPVVAQFTTLLPACSAPTNLTSSYNNNVSTFTWDAVPGAVNYQLQLKFQWNQWSNSNLTVTTNSYSMTGLFQSTPFEWRVRTNCGNNVSAYSAAQAYSTPCPEPSALNVTNITATSASLNWSAAAGYNTTTSDFVVSYRLANTNNTWTSLGHTSNTSINVSGLLSNTTYEWRVNQSCMYSTSNSITSQFTTNYIPCDVPTNISVSNVTASAAKITFTGVSGGLNYSVQYKPTTSSTWSNPIVINTTTLNITGLTASTLYDCRVKANCSAGSSVFLSTQFTTYATTCGAYGVNSSEFIDYFKLGSINRTSAKEVGGYINTGLNTNLVIGSTSNAGQFSAGFNPGIVFGENYAVYIDFNRNGNFNDVGERVINPTYVNSGSAIYNFNIVIPNTATPGACKMRVVMRRSNSSIVPCATGFKGEVEDYDVTLITGVNLRLANTNTQELNTSITQELKSIVYPNPSKGEFVFELQTPSSLKSYNVYNTFGQKVLEKSTENNSAFKIDISHLADGMYILNVLDNEGNNYFHRLQKQ